LGQKIIDMLLLHQAALNEKQEIIVLLKEGIWDGAELSLSLDGGVVQVTLSSLTSEMATTVRLNRHTLCEAILDKMPDIKDVKVSTSLREDADTNHGRSRGYMGFSSDGDEEEETDSKGRRVRRHGRVARKSMPGHA
jgi:hypothetical protein